MFVSDVIDFYDVIKGNRVLLLVGYDVDALCACKILQYLFQCDNVLYTLVPVNGKESLSQAYLQHKDQAKYVVMINCGATFDIVENFQPAEEVVFYIADTHRPVDIYNVYSDSQVRLLMKTEEDEAIPAFDDLFREPEETEEENLKIDETAILKRREKRLWEEKRQKILFDYTQFTYYGLASSLLMFELAWKVSRDSNELLWWAIVGLTEQYVFGKLEQDKYILSAASLQNHVSRHNHKDNSESNSTSVNCMKISFDKELHLSLYRHWSIFESLMHTRYTACKFKLWTFKGQKKMYEFLAEMGLPLIQCKQKFSAMDIQFRNNISTWIEEMSEKYKLGQIVYGSFTSQFGFKCKFCATDIVLAVNSLLESVDREKVHTDKFFDALDALCKSKADAIEKGIELAKFQLIAIFKQVQSFLDMNHIISAGPFLYAVVPESTPDIRYFCSPACLLMLAQFLLQAHVTVSRNKKVRSLPLVLMVPKYENPSKFLAIGIPPVSEDSPKNFFGKAFEQAAERSRSCIVQDYFDSSVVLINSNDRSKFFDALISLLS